MQRLEGAIADMNNDEEFVLNFVQAIGNIYKYASRKAEYVASNEEEEMIKDEDVIDTDVFSDTGDISFRNLRNLQAPPSSESSPSPSSPSNSAPGESAPG